MALCSLEHQSASVFQKKVSNFDDTRAITPKRVTSGGIRLRSLAPGQQSSEETSQQWRVAGDAVSDMTGSENKPMISRIDGDDVNHYVKRPDIAQKIISD